SLGGTLAIGYAQQHPGALGGVVSIDGLPVFPGTENMAGPQRTAMAANMKAQVAGLTRDAFAGQQVQYMKAIGVLDPVRAAELAKLTANSDPASVGTYMADVLTADLRPGLNKIAVPVLVIAPYNAPDAMARGISEEAKAAYYRGLMAGVADLDVATVAPARHFAMLDQPEKVRALVAAFMEKKALR
ncbi:MAG TPA: alpha/beta hydrolase, partial [Burkholderiaceae bacterium]